MEVLLRKFGSWIFNLLSRFSVLSFNWKGIEFTLPATLDYDNAAKNA